MAEKADRLRELLIPGGEPVGSPGSGWRVRVVDGGLPAARDMFEGCKELGEVLKMERYDGIMLDLGNGDRVGIREVSGSGEPTLDIRVQSMPDIHSEIRKIKFTG